MQIDIEFIGYKILEWKNQIIVKMNVFMIKDDTLKGMSQNESLI